MSNENKSESINFENEQIEQRTLNSDEERKIKRKEEAKSSTNTNNFKKSKNKNKSHNKFYKAKLPPISKSKKEQIYTSQRENTANSVFATSYRKVNIDQRDDDDIFLEINKTQKEIKNINRELKSLQKEYKIIEDSNITNKYIIEMKRLKIMKKKKMKMM